MMPATSLQPASVATAPNRRTRLRLDSRLARPCGTAGGPESMSLGAYPLT